MTITGDVQGVFFRDTCRRIATGSGVAGWIRNCADGQVEAWFEGPAAPVDRLVDWCRQGPAGAQVSSVEVLNEEPSGVAGFRIR
ncbi:MAG TPA: acylphosphatase [Acidimicrobiales bacterium]|nr:acylphosphatase [Acidimicrobiales bacterium]